MTRCVPKGVLTLYGVFSWVSGDFTSASNAATYAENKAAQISAS